MSRYKGDNSGGYGNPPIDGQFKKGNRGGGRPNGSVTIETALRKVFRGKVSYKVNGTPVETSAVEALSRRALLLGLSGPQRANAATLDLARKYGPQEEELKPFLTHIDALTADETRVLFRLIAKGRGEPEPVWDHSLACCSDPDDERNYHFETTLEGLEYRRCSITSVEDQLIRIANRGYFSAALPRRPGCYRRHSAASAGSS